MRTHVHFVRLSVLTLLFTVTFSQSKAQSITTGDGKLEIGLGLGPMFFLGDLGGSAGKGKTFIKDLDYPLTKLNKGIFVNYFPAEWLGFRIAANLGQVEGDDKLAPNKGGAERFRQMRNLNFRSKIAEAYIAAEIYPTVFLEQYDGLAGKFRPYGVAGVGLFHFNPEVNDNGTWVKTAPLSLEGQGFPQTPDMKRYKLTQMNLQMGFGLKYYLSDSKYIGFEILHRKLFTDYVDDVSSKKYIDPVYFDQNLTPANAVIARRLAYRGTVSYPNTRPYYRVAQRGDPTENDAFFSTLIRFGWRLNNNSSLRQLKCPVFY